MAVRVMAERSRAEWVWEDRGAGARAVRALLSPASMLFGAVVRARNALYDAHALPVRAPRIPALSIGNLTVGGTGKTPVSSWFAVQLQARGAHPAIVMRGYGADEPLVHERLAPTIPVIGLKVPGAVNSRVVPIASPMARPSRAPRKRESPIRK